MTGRTQASFSPWSFQLKDLLWLLGAALGVGALTAAGAAQILSIVAMPWATGGLCLTIVLVRGWRFWPALWLGLAGGHLCAGWSPGLSALIACILTLGPVIASAALKHTRFNVDFETPLDYALLIAGAALSALTGAGIGIPLLSGIGAIPASTPGYTWLWLEINFLLIALSAPTFLVWRHLPRDWANGGKTLEALLLIGIVLGEGWSLLNGTKNSSLSVLLRPEWMPLVVLWSAMRLGRHGATLATYALMLILLLGQSYSIDSINTGVSPVETALRYALLLTGATGILIALVLRQQRVANDTLRTAQTLNRTVLDSLKERVAVVDHKGIIIAANSACHQAWTAMGIIAAEHSALGQSYRTVCPVMGGDNGEQACHALDEILHGKRALYETEYRMDVESVPHWFRMRITPLEEASAGAIIVHQDITAITLSHEQHVFSVIEASPDAAVVARADGSIRYVNSAACKLFGYAQDEFSRLSVDDLLPHTLRDRHAEHRASFARHPSARGMGISHDLQAVTKSGKHLAVEISLSPITLSGESVVIASIADISWRKTTEQELLDNQRHLRELNASLEDRVQERTRELAIARDQAEAANRMKSQFLANMSHEIRTPMNAVLGMTQVALREHPDAAQRRHLEKIYQAGEHLLWILDDILDFSRIEAGKLTLAHNHFAMEEVLRRLDSVCGEALRRKGLIWMTAIDPEIPPYLQGDPVRLAQILINYLNNAIKFTERGTVRLDIRCLQRMASHCTLRFEIADTGIGIPPEAASRIFESFEQADGSITRQFGGTGLGLAINKALAQLMRGEVGVDSHPGQGSTFWLEVTLETGTTPAAVSAVPANADLAGYRILVVDDNELNLEVASQMLLSCGAAVITAADGNKALMALAKNPVDCVLMDVQMPVMDGLETTRRIRRTPGLHNLRVIAMTANARQADKEACLAAGMNDFITKPFTLDDLLTRLQGKAQEPSDVPAVTTAPSEPATPSAIDFNILSAAVNGDEARMKKYAQLFLDNVRNELPLLEAAITASDRETLARIGHKLKSSAKWVGAIPFAERCLQLEALRKEGDLTKAADHLNALTQEFVVIETAAQARFGSLHRENGS